MTNGVVSICATLRAMPETAVIRGSKSSTRRFLKEVGTPGDKEKGYKKDQEPPHLRQALGSGKGRVSLQLFGPHTDSAP